MHFPNNDLSGERGALSQSLIDAGIQDLYEAVSFLKNLTYGRTTNKYDFKSVINEKRGTCSSKHGALSILFDENLIKHSLILGVFKMNSVNTPEISSVLNRHRIEYIPEAHCYIKVSGQVIDISNKNSSPEMWINDLLEEREINPSDIATLKEKLHKNFLKTCELKPPFIEFNVNQLWEIREECIQKL